MKGNIKTAKKTVFTIYYVSMLGYGVFLWSDGSQFQGHFVSNNIEGHGIYKWADSRVYEGDWIANKMHGKGVFTWSDGRRYSFVKQI